MDNIKNENDSPSLQTQLVEVILLMEVGDSFDLPLAGETPASRRVQVYEALEDLCKPVYGLAEVPTLVTSFINDDQVIRVWRVDPEYHNPKPRASSFKKVPPKWTMEFLTKGAPAGSKHNEAFKAACSLAQHGYDENDIMYFFDSVPGLIMTLQDLRKIMQTVRSACTKKAKGTLSESPSQH